MMQGNEIPKVQGRCRSVFASVMSVWVMGMIMVCWAPSLLGQDALKRPNFIFIFADDLGWTSTSVQMDDEVQGSKSDFYQTPNLERLAQQGMRFSRGYASAAICSPSRRSIQFGQTPARHGDQQFAEQYHPDRVRRLTIPGVLKSIDPS